MDASSSQPPQSLTRPNARSDFEVAIICALHLEFDAVCLLIDQLWDEDGDQYGKVDGDPNVYTTGRMGKCNVVLVLLPNMGKASAASAAASLRSSYPRVSLAFLVGICGAVPFAGPERDPVVLGDVIISNCVVQYDLGRALPDRFDRKDTAHDSLGRPNKIIRNILLKLGTNIDCEHIEKRAGDFLKALQTKSEEKAKRKRRGKHTSYKYPGAANDLLFPAWYRHKHAPDSGCRTCENCHGNADPACDESLRLSCKELECDTSCVIRREHLESASNDPSADSDSEGVFFFIGAVGSGDSVIRSGEHRDQIAKQAKVIAFEMEGAGVWDEVPCIVIKGVCDYADSHKTKEWQSYAAATAASVAKAVMERYVASARVYDSSQSLNAGPGGGQINQSAGGVTLTPGMGQFPSASFGPLNQGFQVGQSYAPINAEFHLPPERLETPPPPFATIPFSRDPDFVNRGDILDQIDQRCSEPAGRVALVGLGGVGKSQLAIEYAYRTAAKEPDRWVFWVHAGTQARVEEGFKAIADAVKLPGRKQPKADVPQLVYSWLSNERDRRWIVILDSADDVDVFFGAGSNPERRPLADYLPQSPNGSLLVTTRNKNLACRLVGGYKNTIEIGPMAEGDALLLLERKLSLLSDKDSAEELVRALEYVPLAISQAAAYIQRMSPRSSVKKYLAEFHKGESKRARLLSHDAGEFRREGGASSAILTTWRISFEHIRSKRASAADLLSLMSFFDRQGIPESLLRPPHMDEAIQERGSDVQHDLGSNSSDDDRENDETDSGFEDNIAMLTDFCLVTVSESGETFEMHGLVQLSTRTWLKACGREEEFKHQFVSRIAALFPPGGYSNWATCQRLFPHVEKAVDYRPVESKLEEAWATLLYNGGWYAELQGRYEVAEKMAHKSMRSRKEILGREDERALASTSLYAEVLRDKGLWKEAETLEVQVMETRKAKLGADHPSTLTSMANLASTYRNQGRWEEAEKLEVQVMETRKAKLGADHPDTLTSMANLASTFWNQGRWEEAEKLFVQVMETRKAKLGANHPDTLTSMANLASTYSNQGRWEEAEKLEVQVMETRKAKLGANHPDTLTSMANLASTLWNQGRWEEAEKLFVQVMEMSKAKLGADHPSTLTSMANLASTYRNQGRWEEAEKLFVQVMETSKAKLGADHPDTLTSMANLASTYRNQGRWEEAEKLEVQVMETRKAKLGADHPSTLTSMANLASTYRNQGRWEEAEKLFVQVMETSKAKLGADHPSTLTSMGNLASTYSNQGRWEEAEKLEVQVMETRKAKLGADHPSTLTSMANLASTYSNQGRWEEAEKLFVQVMETSKAKLGADHPSTLTSMANLASTLWNQGRWEEAEKLDVQVMETRKAKLGADHPDTLTSMANLASTLWNQGRWEEAEKLFVQVMEMSKAKLGADHPSTLNSMASLSFTWNSQGRHEDALALMQDCVEARQRVLGPEHPDTLSSLASVSEWSS
ncbi:hypothetical protein SMAC4_13902 [Sordaria macrospora]|uniref:uncharacterized protein n=1 Tax=Sordaria macrospora TaxID=5147 RepID=UPI002B2C560F|nr:hypothetical protein SMAC4_13902 [Sordaria macrospora]